MNLRSIRFRLTVWYAAILALLLMIFCVATYLGLERYLTSNLKQSLTNQTREIGVLLAHVYLNQWEKEIAEIKEHYAPEASNRFLRILREDGNVLYVSGTPRDQSFDPTQVPSAMLVPAQDSVREITLPGGGKLLISALVFATRDNGRVIVETGASYGQVKDVTKNLLIVFGISLPLVIGVAIGGGYSLARRALRPIDEITRSAELITSRNLSERLPAPKTDDEIERLSTSLNRMIERLEKAFRHINRFSADASHELRTPLTILRGELELIVGRRSVASDVREKISSALEEIDRLTKITESLLVISKLDAGETLIERQRVDLADLVRVTTAQLSLLAEDKDIELTSDILEPAEVEGNPLRLKQVVVNLLDNAIKYTPETGKVRVSIKTVNGLVILEVGDNGPGIKADSLPHIFERFYRVDKARTRKFGGVGLGLAIARSICLAHGGEIRVESTVAQGSRFQVLLPSAARPLDEHR